MSNSAKAPKLTQSLVQSILDYDPETGQFRWRQRADVGKAWNKRYAGKVAGYVWRASPNVQYRCIRILDWPFLAHRVAWLHVTGEWPENLIDHRDMNGLNNAWANLRAADKTQNGNNRGVTRRNKLGLKGVRQQGSRFHANISINGRQTYLGSFATAQDAHKAYCRAAVKHRGEFGRGQ